MCWPRGGRSSCSSGSAMRAALRPLRGALRPVVVVFEDPDHARAFPARVFLHPHQHRITFGKRRARRTLVVEDQEFSVRAVDVAPHAGFVLDFNLELHTDHARADCSAAIRASIGGCDANSASRPPPPLVMPGDDSDGGSAPPSRPPRRASAWIIGCGEPSKRAEPASARNSRSRENHATITDAMMPKTIWQTMTVM